MSNQIDINVVTLGGVNPIKIESGSTVSTLRYVANLSSSVKVVTEDGNILKDSDMIVDSCSLFISVPKQNA